MMGIPANTYNRLRNILLRSDALSDNSKLRAVFVDARIAAWHDALPQIESGSVLERIESTVRFLWQKHDTDGENALVLLLQVLYERVDSKDHLSRELGALVDELKSLPVTKIIMNVSGYPVREYLTNGQKPVDKTQMETTVHSEMSGILFSLAITKNQIVLNMHWSVLMVILILTTLLIAFAR